MWGGIKGGPQAVSNLEQSPFKSLEGLGTVLGAYASVRSPAIRTIGTVGQWSGERLPQQSQGSRESRLSPDYQELLYRLARQRLGGR